MEPSRREFHYFLFVLFIMPRRQTTPEPAPLKGQEITIVRGNYQGLKAWTNDAKPQPSKMLYVIIAMPEGDEITTKVRKTSVGPPRHDPTSFEEAALQQIPEIEIALRKAASLWAKCGVTHDWNEACRIFAQIGMEEATNLAESGPKASYFHVQFQSENN